jgi:hypothetical protein
MIVKSLVLVLIYIYIYMIMRLKFVPSPISCGLSVIRSLNNLQLYSKSSSSFREVFSLVQIMYFVSYGMHSKLHTVRRSTYSRIEMWLRFPVNATVHVRCIVMQTSERKCPSDEVTETHAFS